MILCHFERSVKINDIDDWMTGITTDTLSSILLDNLRGNLQMSNCSQMDAHSHTTFTCKTFSLKSSPALEKAMFSIFYSLFLTKNHLLVTYYDLPNTLHETIQDSN